MKIIKKTSFHNTSPSKGRKLKYIVIHYTAGIKSSKGSAENTAGWFNSPNALGSADFIVDEETILQYNPDIEGHYTWHCGGNKYNTKGGRLYGAVTNYNSIGIEMCSHNRAGKVTATNDGNWEIKKKVQENTIELVRYLMKKYGIKPENVVRHYDVNGKPCPGVQGWNADTGSEKAWDSFRERLRAGGKEITTSEKKAPRSEKYKTTVTAESLNVRAGAGVSFPIIRALKKNERITVAATKNGWGKLEGDGWVNLKYVKKG